MAHMCCPRPFDIDIFSLWQPRAPMPKAHPAVPPVPYAPCTRPAVHVVRPQARDVTASECGAGEGASYPAGADGRTAGGGAPRSAATARRKAGAPAGAPPPGGAGGGSAWGARGPLGDLGARGHPRSGLVHGGGPPSRRGKSTTAVAPDRGDGSHGGPDRAGLRGGRRDALPPRGRARG